MRELIVSGISVSLANCVSGVIRFITSDGINILSGSCAKSSGLISSSVVGFRPKVNSWKKISEYAKSRG